MKIDRVKKRFKYFFKEERYVLSLRRTFVLVNSDLKKIELKLRRVRYDRCSVLMLKIWNLEIEIDRTIKEFDDICFWTKKKYYLYYNVLKIFERRLDEIMREFNAFGCDAPKGQRFSPIDPFGEENWEN